MAEVLRALAPSAIGVYMPLDEMPKPLRDEGLEAIGDQLMALYELTEELSEGDFMLRLSDGRLVAYSYGGHLVIQTEVD